MIREAIEKIEEIIHEPEDIIEVNGLTYSTLALTPIKPPELKPVVMSTLTGLIDFLDDQIDDDCPCMMFVENENNVVILGDIANGWGQRPVYAGARFIPPANHLGGNNWRKIDETLIALQTQFEPTAERDALIETISKVHATSIIKAEDSGAGQRITVENEIGRLDYKPIKPIWNLKPYRTFHEIEQVEVPFLIRFRAQGEKELPLIAFFDADGGMWKKTAIMRIADYLKTNDIVVKAKIKVVA